MVDQNVGSENPLDFFLSGKKICEEGVGSIVDDLGPSGVSFKEDGGAVRYALSADKVFDISRFISVSVKGVINQRWLDGGSIIAAQQTKASFISGPVDESVERRNLSLTVDAIDGIVTDGAEHLLQTVADKPILSVNCWFGWLLHESMTFYSRDRADAALRHHCEWRETCIGTAAGINLHMLVDLELRKVLALNIGTRMKVPFQHVYVDLPDPLPAE